MDSQVATYPIFHWLISHNESTSLNLCRLWLSGQTVKKRGSTQLRENLISINMSASERETQIDPSFVSSCLLVSLFSQGSWSVSRPLLSRSIADICEGHYKFRVFRAFSKFVKGFTDLLGIVAHSTSKLHPSTTRSSTLAIGHPATPPTINWRG